jgi:polysaccharide biosynthesis/export protein
MNYRTRIARIVVVVLSVCAAPALAQPNPQYRLRPTDVVNVEYRYSPEFSHEAVVGPDGYVNLPVLGSVEIGGLTIAEAHASLLSIARTRLNDPEIVISLTEYEKPYVTVAGHVTTPGKLELKGRLTVLEAIALSGGLRQEAKQSQVLLLRRFSADELETKIIDVRRLMTKAGIQDDLALRPNDILVVPQDRISKVDRIVKLLNLGLYMNPAALLVP